MSDHFADQNNAKLSNSIDNLDYFQSKIHENPAIDELNAPYDHMYATNHDENGLSDDPQTSNQPESRVKFLKEFLLIHLDLIQQQNDDILNKEQKIFLLQDENARLRERLRCLENGLPYQSTSNLICNQCEVPSESLPEDMTQDSGLIEDNSQIVAQIPDEPLINNLCIQESEIFQDNQLTESNKSQELLQKIQFVEERDFKIKEELEENIAAVNSSSEITPEDLICSNNLNNTSYTIHSNSVTSSDPMKNLKMSIRRKRLCSNSSAVSNNDSMSDEKRNFGRSRKKRKRIFKNDQILTHNEQYVTIVGEQYLDALRRQKLADEAARAASSSNLEVPRWRVKVYTSCYTMEGTENLEDEMYSRRHNRLENDERRRKRWDVQRIREQRIIEKLKQRQDKIDSNNKGIEQTDAIESLWPPIEDIKYIEMSDVLPVSAFGCPMPKIQPSEFSVPWLNNPNIKKTATRRGPIRRRGTKR